jgi:hypothetical protein
MRKRVEHHVWQAWEFAFGPFMFLLPQVEPLRKLKTTLNCRFRAGPSLYGFRFELEEDPFPLVLESRQPSDLAGKGGSTHANIQLPFDIRTSSLESCESDLSHNFPQTLD